MSRHPLPARRFRAPALSVAAALGLAILPNVGAASAHAAEPGARANVAISTPAAALTPASDIVESRGSFESQGKTIAIERFEPKAAGRYPAVVIVHGAGGVTIGGIWFRDAARQLARNGYVAHVIHYFDVSGTRVADIPTMKEQFPAWMKVVAEAVTNVSKQPNVDARRVGLVGYSLGSYLSLSLSLYDPRVLAVVEFYGGIPEPLLKEVKTLPPTLILHGDADLVVPVAERILERLYKLMGAPHEVKIYEGQPHGFTGDPVADANQRAVAFFDRHLKGADLSKPREAAVLPEPAVYAQMIRSVNSVGKGTVPNVTPSNVR